jgi:hypothetical protein
MLFRFAPALMLLVTATLASAAPAPVVGGWDYAKWGMTRAQVAAVAGGATHATDDPQTDTVDGDYTLGGFKFAVRLQYDDGTLTEVVLNLDASAGKCAPLGAYLRKTYGPANSTSSGGYDSSIWVDAASGNQITYATLAGGTVCELIYDPIPTATDTDK